MLRRYTPFDDLYRMVNELDDIRRSFMEEPRPLAGDFFPFRRLPAMAPKAEFVPVVECFTKDKNIVLRAELPGVDPSHVEICVAGDQLVLKGEKKDDRKVEEKDLYIREIHRGRFERAFTLPEGVKADQIKAIFTNGMLELTFPMASFETTKKVAIETEEIGKKTVKAA